MQTESNDSTIPLATLPSTTLPAPGESVPRAERQQLTAELLERACSTDDPVERERLIDEVVLLNMCVARSISRRHSGKGIAQDDLEQVAYLALVRAAQKFEASRHRDFLSYAVPTIRGELKKHFRDQGWTVRPPRHVQEVQAKVIAERSELTQRLGRNPTAAELAEAVDEDVAVVDEALGADGCFQPASLDRPVGEESGTTLGDLLDDDHDEREQEIVEARVMLAPVVRRLSERDRRILRLRYFEGCTQQEIADDIGVTQMQVSRLITRIVRDIRREVPRDDESA
ncbi:MAG TPA: sigma-70 family RNA polymerase sigma factor [Marmoricola sp.]|nr:sigma-70 family RNA polymerase sigma factor [Marmoricola sp.]